MKKLILITSILFSNLSNSTEIISPKVFDPVKDQLQIKQAMLIDGFVVVDNVSAKKYMSNK